jgi:hypothetical protein
MKKIPSTLFENISIVRDDVFNSILEFLWARIALFLLATCTSFLLFQDKFYLKASLREENAYWCGLYIRLLRYTCIIYRHSISFNSKQSAKKKKLMSQGFTSSFLQVFWSLQRPSLPLHVQPFFGPNAVWCVSCQSLSCFWYTDFDYGSNRLPELELGLTAGVTGRQGMLTPPRHLIPPLMFPWVRVSLIWSVGCSIYLHWTLILTADFPVYFTIFFYHKMIR